MVEVPRQRLLPLPLLHQLQEGLAGGGHAGGGALHVAAVLVEVLGGDGAARVAVGRGARQRVDARDGEVLEGEGALEVGGVGARRGLLPRHVGVELQPVLLLRGERLRRGRHALELRVQRVGDLLRDGLGVRAVGRGADEPVGGQRGGGGEGGHVGGLQGLRGGGADDDVGGGAQLEELVAQVAGAGAPGEEVGLRVEELLVLVVGGDELLEGEEGQAPQLGGLEAVGGGLHVGQPGEQAVLARLQLGGRGDGHRLEVLVVALPARAVPLVGLLGDHQQRVLVEARVERGGGGLERLLQQGAGVVDVQQRRDRGAGEVGEAGGRGGEVLLGGVRRRLGRGGVLDAVARVHGDQRDGLRGGRGVERVVVVGDGGGEVAQLEIARAVGGDVDGAALGEDGEHVGGAVRGGERDPAAVVGEHDGLDRGTGEAAVQNVEQAVRGHVVQRSREGGVMR